MSCTCCIAGALHTDMAPSLRDKTLSVHTNSAEKLSRIARLKPLRDARKGHTLARHYCNAHCAILPLAMRQCHRPTRLISLYNYYASHVPGGHIAMLLAMTI